MRAEPIRLAAWSAPVSVLGPGRRAALWVHGCARACPGCIAADWNESVPSDTVDPEFLAADILRADRRIATAAGENTGLEGVTFSGGEPIDRAPPLLRVWRTLKSRRPDWTLILYTGHDWHAVHRQGAAALDLVAEADVLIAGPYRAALDDGRGLRGSSNQSVHFLTDAHRDQAPLFLTAERRLELRFDAGGVLLAGLPPRRFLARVGPALADLVDPNRRGAEAGTGT